ncbi:Trichothecene C-15 hydroxylase [Colletotrichum sp. SAR11_239]|nr:Trichothecene C-15 hydroxylase [Colletotrichum sp. SAR11_239]
MDMALPTTRLTGLADSYPVVAAVSAAISVAIVYFIVLLPLYNILLHPLRKYPGPKLWAASQIPWLRSYTGGLYHVKLRDMHEKYGPVVRVGPNELSFTSPEAWQAVMGHHARPDLVHGMTVGKGGLTVSREELNENSEALIIAGSETTATALSGAIYMLTTHPAILKTLAEEIRSAFTSESEMNSTVLSIPHWAMYHTSSNFSRPDEFIPNRWLDDPQFASDRKECMNVFSFGPRNCIGKNLAYVEMRMFLARAIWNFDIELAAESMDWLQKGRSFSVWAKHPLMVHLTPRPVAV